MKKLKLYAGLMKIPLSLMISLSAIFGFIINKNSFDTALFLTAAAIFLLACGGACLNNYQDRHIDRLFSRTRHRALPAGKLPASRALVLSIALIFSGTMLLYLIRYNVLLPLLGGASILLYNGIYTPLKPRTVLAIIPGALCGMMPPLIGWSAAGGDLFSLKIVSIMVLFGIWQLPHFWLILLNHCTEYSRSAMPNMLHHFNRFQLKKILFIWIVNFSVMLLFIPILYWGNQNTTGWILATAALVLIFVAFLNIFQHRHQNNYIPLFKFLHGTIFIVMLVIVVGRLI
jgi:protoheme IX farnesyltransferase